MSSNVINLFDLRRPRAAVTDSSAKSELSVQLDLPFEEASATELAAASHSFVENELVQTQAALTQQHDALRAAAGSLESHTDKYLFFAYADAFAFQDDFLNLCKAMSPDLILDLRVAPRLDFVRPLRKQAFELFDMCGIEYRDMFGRLNAGTYDLPQSRFEELINSVASLHSSHDGGRPTLCLFDNPTFAQFCTAKLAQSLPLVSLDTDAVRRMVAEGARVRM